MARLITCGYEANDVGIDGFPGTTATTLNRGGARGCTANTNDVLFTGAHGTTYYARAYFNFTLFPTGLTQLVSLATAVNAPIGAVYIDEFGVFSGKAGVSSLGSTLQASLNTWYRVEVAIRTSATASSTYVEWRIDGVSMGTTSTANLTTVMGLIAIYMGLNSMTGAIDDVAFNDSSGANQNSWPGDGTIVLLWPISDNAGGTGWTLGTGTALGGNGFASVNNRPPLGLADLAVGSDNKQIRNATSNANVNYDANMRTYATAGIAQADTITLIDPIVATAAPVTTSAKQGTVGVVSNPAITNVALGAGGTSGAFWSGTAAGTYPTGWKISHGTITYGPSVTVGTSPVMRITQVTSSTRIAMVCSMFMYVEYVPLLGRAVDARVNTVAVQRASNW